MNLVSVISVADPQNGQGRYDDGRRENRDNFLRIFGLSSTLLKNVDGVGRNHEAADRGEEWIDLADALVRD